MFRTIRLRAALAAASAAVLAACSDRPPEIVAPPSHTVPATPAGPVLTAAAVACEANVQARTMACGPPDAPVSVGGLGDIVVGGQHQYVALTSTNVSYNGASHIFAFDVTVQNLIAQSMGTTDGTTPDANGVRVFFHSGPTPTGGTGNATVANNDGTGSFTGSNQPFFTYSGGNLGGDGMLSPNETSAAKTWQLNVDPTVTTFTFLLYVTAAVPAPNGYVDVSPGAASMVVGGATQTLTPTVRSAVGNAIAGQTVTWGTSDNTVATVNASGVVTAVAPGLATITATSGSRTGGAVITVCPNLSVGGTYQLSLSGAKAFCLAGGASGQEYTVIPANTSTTADAVFSFTGTGISSVTGPPTPDRVPAAITYRIDQEAVHPDDAWEWRFRERELAAVTPALRRVEPRAPSSPTGPRPRLSIVPGVPTVGTVMNLNVSQGFCSPLDVRAATVKSVGTHIILMEDNSNPAGGLTTAQYDSVAADFDTLAYPAVAGTFGAPFDIDNNGGRVIALYTAAVNDLTPAGSSSFVGGFFYSRDLFMTVSCAGSNQGEMFYMLAPDPTGAHGNVRTAAFVRTQTVGTLGHEFQHLINASRRTYGVGGPYPLEQVWLNEGLSHIAEEEVYYASSLHGPGENISLSTITANQTQQDRFLGYAEPNFGRLRQWLLSPQSHGAFEDIDNLAVRGSAWAFLRYLVDRKGGLESDFFSGLAFSPDTGWTNLTNRLGTDPMPQYRDFTAAMYGDDASLGVASQFTQPSWNFRSIFGGLSYGGNPPGYPLAPRNPSNGVADVVTLRRGGGTAFERLRVAASGFGTVVLGSGGATSNMTIIRTK